MPPGRLLAIDAKPAPAEGEWDSSLLPHLPDLERAGFVARTTARNVVRVTALERPHLLDDPLFFREVVTLIERYLLRPGRRTRTGGSKRQRGGM